MAVRDAAHRPFKADFGSADRRNVLTPVICLVVLLAVVVVGHAQAQSRKDEPSLLRFEAWQLFGLVVQSCPHATRSVYVCVSVPSGSCTVYVWVSKPSGTWSW